MAKRRKPRIIPVNHFDRRALRRLTPGPMRTSEFRAVFGAPRFRVGYDGKQLRFTAR